MNYVNQGGDFFYIFLMFIDDKSAISLERTRVRRQDESIKFYIEREQHEMTCHNKTDTDTFSYF